MNTNEMTMAELTEREVSRLDGGMTTSGVLAGLTLLFLFSEFGRAFYESANAASAAQQCP